MLNVLLYCSAIIGRLHSFIVSVRELRFKKMRIIAEKYNVRIVAIKIVN